MHDEGGAVYFSKGEAGRRIGVQGATASTEIEVRGDLHEIRHIGSALDRIGGSFPAEGHEEGVIPDLQTVITI